MYDKAMLRENIDRWAPRAFVIAALLMILFFLASLVIIYVGYVYVTPAWDEQSVPAPGTYLEERVLARSSSARWTLYRRPQAMAERAGWYS